jgi:hypothetical protein
MALFDNAREKFCYALNNPFFYKLVQTKAMVFEQITNEIYLKSITFLI